MSLSRFLAEDGPLKEALEWPAEELIGMQVEILRFGL